MSRRSPGPPSSNREVVELKDAAGGEGAARDGFLGRWSMVFLEVSRVKKIQARTHSCGTLLDVLKDYKLNCVINAVCLIYIFISTTHALLSL